MKTLSNKDFSDAEKKIKDIEFFGDPDSFQLLCKAWSEEEGWMKSTKAMEIPGIGCIVQVSTQQASVMKQHSLAEAVCFVPGVEIQPTRDENGKIIGRSLVSSL